MGKNLLFWSISLAWLLLMGRWSSGSSVTGNHISVVKKSEKTKLKLKSLLPELSKASELQHRKQFAVLTSNLPKPWYMQLLPVYPREIPKFLSLSMMMFWIVFVFTLTRDTKDTLIVTNCGAEAIAFLKVYGVVPAAAGFMIMYSKLANVLSPRTLFYVTLAPFFVFYFLFAFVLYPLRNVLHPLHLAVPEGGFSYAVNLLRYWTFSLYYVVSELWGSAGIPLLFWSCANDVIRVKEVRSLSVPSTASPLRLITVAPKLAYCAHTYCKHILWTPHCP